MLISRASTFSPFFTSYRDFEETYLARAGNYGDQPFIFAVPMIVWRRAARERGWDVVESLCAFAQPGGLTRRDVYESFRDEILHDLQQVLPVDAVFLSLHGAMVAAGYDDCEGDLIAHIKLIVPSSSSTMSGTSAPTCIADCKRLWSARWSTTWT